MPTSVDVGTHHDDMKITSAQSSDHCASHEQRGEGDEAGRASSKPDGNQMVRHHHHGRGRRRPSRGRFSGPARAAIMRVRSTALSYMSTAFTSSSRCECSTLALMTSRALQICEPRKLRSLIEQWSDEAKHAGVTWQGRAELRAGLPMLHDIRDACVLAGDGAILSGLEEVGADAQAHCEYWICTQQAFISDTRDSFETCEVSEQLSDFYGEAVVMCTRSLDGGASG